MPLVHFDKMKFSLRQLLGLVAVAAAVSLLATSFLHSKSPDAWGYGKLGVAGGSATSPVYYIEVRGVGAAPTMARLVKFDNATAAPKNALEVSHGVSAEIQESVQVIDPWNGTFTLIAGRTLDEKVTITLDASTATRLFAQPGSQFDNYGACVDVWDKYIAPHLPAEIDD